MWGNTVEAILVLLASNRRDLMAVYLHNAYSLRSGHSSSLPALNLQPAATPGKYSIFLPSP